MYGSAGNSTPPYMNMGGFQQKNFSPVLNGALNYGQQRAWLMPGFKSGPMGQYGASGSQPWPTGPDGNPITIPPPLPPRPPPLPPRNARVDFPQWEDKQIGSPPSAFGFGTPPVAQQLNTRPAEYTAQDPSSAFGVGQAMSPPVQAQPTVAQNPNAAMMNAFSNQIASFKNPMGLTQQQLGPSFNPVGSAQGGYFNGNQYVPNVGNPRNGLDNMARWGQNWNGAPLNGGGLFIR